jgi:hypothetical protein
MRRKNSKPLVVTKTIRKPKNLKREKKHPPLVLKKDGSLSSFYRKILSRFEPEEIQYYAGLMDGDGSIGWNSHNSKTIRLQINLTEEAAEPLFELAEKLDIPLSRSEVTEEFKKERKNDKPCINLNIYREKAWFFLLLIYPYLLEKKEKGKELLITKFRGFLDCHQRRMHQRHFSFPYLAGYSDAEGHFKYKYKQKEGFNFGYIVHSTAIGHIDYLGEQLCRLGYRVNYSKVYKKTNRKPSKKISITNLLDLKKLYEELIPFVKIKRKKRAMTMTNFYTNYLSPRYSEKERRLIKK